MTNGSTCSRHAWRRAFRLRGRGLLKKERQTISGSQPLKLIVPLTSSQLVCKRGRRMGATNLKEGLSVVNLWSWS